MSEKKELDKEQLEKVSGGRPGLYDENTDQSKRDLDRTEEDKETGDLT